MKRVGNWFKSEDHYVNTIKMLIKKQGFHYIPQELQDVLEELYDLSYRIQEDGREIDVRLPALWYGFQLRDCTTSEELVAMIKILFELIADTRSFLLTFDESVFDNYDDFEYKGWRE